MKKLLFIIIAIAVCTTLNGQQIDQSNNRYRSYDVLEKKLVTVKGFDLNSKKGVWSLEDAELSEGTYKAEYSTETDTLVAVERGDRTYYSQDRDHGDGSTDYFGHRKNRPFRALKMITGTVPLIIDNSKYSGD